MKICLSPSDRSHPGRRSELFSSVAGDSVAFSQDFIVSLDFFGSFLCQDKNEHVNNQSFSA